MPINKIFNIHTRKAHIYLCKNQNVGILIFVRAKYATTLAEERKKSEST